MIEILDIFGVVFICLFTIASTFLSYYILSKYSHKREKEYPLKKITRAIIIIGMVAISLIIVLLPIDFLSVSEERNIRIGLNYNFTYLWQILFILLIGIFFINNFFIEFYRSDQEGLKRIIFAFKKPAFYFLGFISISVLYSFLISIRKDAVMLSTSISSFNKSDSSQIIIPEMQQVDITYIFKGEFFEALIMPFFVLATITMCIVGGASLAFFPIELINTYLYRPLPPTAEDIVYAKNCLLKNSEEMIKNGKDIYDEIRKTEINDITNKRQLKMTHKILNNKMHELKRKHFEYQKIYDHYQKIDNLIQQDPLYYLTNLILGIFFGILSLIILSHVLLTITNIQIILNGILTMFKDINHIFLFFFFFLLCIYLIICILSSQYKISLMFSSFIVHHPFKINNTWVDTFLVNNNIIILSLVGFICLIYRSCPVFNYTNTMFFFRDVMINLRLIRMFYRSKIPQFIFLLFFFMSIFISFFMKQGRTLLYEEIDQFKIYLNEEKTMLKNEKMNTI